MITYFDVLENPPLLALTEDFSSLFGGEFASHAVGLELFYSSEGDKDAYISPREETADSLRQILQDSIHSKKNLIAERWPPLIYKPGCLY